MLPGREGGGECPKMPGLGGLGLAFHGLSFQVYFDGGFKSPSSIAGDRKT